MLKHHFGLLVLTLCAVSAAAQEIDPELFSAIQNIQAVDNHTHVPKLVQPGDRDDDYDALPCGGYVEPSAEPFMARAHNPKYIQAWKQLYGYKYSDAAAAHVQELIAARERTMAEQGNAFPLWVLDRLKIQYMLANRVAMGTGLPRERFLWVPFADPLLLPFDTRSLADTPDRRVFFQREQKLRDRYLAELNVKKLPATLEEYIRAVVVPTLTRQRNAGAVAIKFEAAYLRSLDFGIVGLDAANSLYARFAGGGTIPNRDDYLRLQDAIFRRIALEAGRLKLPVHIHTGTGCGGYFDLRGSDPLLLDAILNDPALRNTVFVLVHGGSGPFTKQAAFQIGKPNVYLDFSEQDWALSARTMSVVLRDYLEAFPEKVLFGTDLFPGPPEMDWEVTGWQINATAREALAMALTSMIRDNEITREHALQLARMVLRENAIKLYGLK